MKRAVTGIAALVLGAAGTARAEEPRTCDAAFEASELQLRPGETHLLEARESLRACALPTCKAWMIDDCTKRLVELERRIPTVVFTADDGRGNAIYDVRVLEGERELAARIDGRGVQMDPGAHALVAERGGARVSLDIVAIEGQRTQPVVFTFPAPAGPVLPPPPPPRRAHPWAPPLALGLVAGGVVAAGIGTGFGIAALTKKNNANCNADDVCTGSPSGARDAAHVSTAAFIVAGALAVGGVVTYLVFGRTYVQASLGGARVGTAW